MRIVSVVQRKGGAGKTTLAVNLAGELARRGGRVVLVDTDPQGSAYDWALPRRLAFVVRHDVPSAANASSWIEGVKALAAHVVILDSPADLGSIFNLCVRVADLMLVPCGPSSLDLNVTRQTLARAAAIDRALNREGPARLLVPTRVDLIEPEGMQIAPALAEFGSRVAPPMSLDMAYVRAFTAGQTISAFAPGSFADLEMRAIADAVLLALRTAPPQRTVPDPLGDDRKSV